MGSKIKGLGGSESKGEGANGKEVGSRGKGQGRSERKEQEGVGRRRKGRCWEEMEGEVFG